MTAVRCCARIHDPEAPSNTAQLKDCSRAARWFVAHRDDRGVCTQHRHPKFDTRPIR